MDARPDAVLASGVAYGTQDSNGDNAFDTSKKVLSSSVKVTDKIFKIISKKKRKQDFY